MGVWKTVALFVRALVVPKCRLAVENLALRQQLASTTSPSNGHGYDHVIACSGSGFPNSALNRVQHWSSSSQKPWSAGTDRDFACIGDGSLERIAQVDRESIKKSVT